LRSYAPIIDDFVEFGMRARLLGSCDITQDCYDSVQPVRGLLHFLGQFGFFDAGYVEEALDIVGAGGVVGGPRRLSQIAAVLKDLDDALA
jgi:hypothetical protein